MDEALKDLELDFYTARREEKENLQEGNED